MIKNLVNIYINQYKHLFIINTKHLKFMKYHYLVIMNYNIKLHHISYYNHHLILMIMINFIIK